VSGTHLIELFGASPDTVATTGNGTFTNYLVCANTGGVLYFSGRNTGGSGASFKVDDFSVKEVQGNVGELK